MIQIFLPLGFLGSFWSFARTAMVDVELVLELLDNKEIIPECENPVKDFNKDGGDIEFRNVSFTYDKKLKVHERRTIIDNLSFKIKKGQSVAIVGTTGAGKSTIMRLLYRFYDVDEGQILINGVDITKMKITDLRSLIGIVPQDCVLFNDTVRYNIAYGAIQDKEFRKHVLDTTDESKAKVDERIIPASEKAQFHQFIEMKAKGYEETVGERGLKLSGGEKQRVAIARALLKKTPIMLFDEATSALDTETEREVQAAINDVAKDSTSIIIAHRLSTIQDCDKIIVLKYGNIIEEGSHDELLQKENGHYRELWSKQSDQQKYEEQQKQEEKQHLEEMNKVFEKRQRRMSVHSIQSLNVDGEDSDN
jgi:ATP-binding cassette subfamily B protein